jgi:hypothetical protein
LSFEHVVGQVVLMPLQTRLLSSAQVVPIGSAAQVPVEQPLAQPPLHASLQQTPLAQKPERQLELVGMVQVTGWPLISRQFPDALQLWPLPALQTVPVLSSMLMTVTPHMPFDPQLRQVGQLDIEQQRPSTHPPAVLHIAQAPPL